MKMRVAANSALADGETVNLAVRAPSEVDTRISLSAKSALAPSAPSAPSLACVSTA